MSLNISDDLCSPHICQNQSVTNMTCDNDSFSLGRFEMVADLYNNSHGYISSSVCVLGVIFNILTIIVLTRPNMRTPTNFLLTTVSIADSITMGTYAVYTLYLDVFTEPDACGLYRHARLSVVFILLHTWLMITTHSIATIAMVVLAAMRCISVYNPLSGPKLCTMRHVRSTVLLVCLISGVSASPVLFMYRVCQISASGSWWFEIRGVVAETLETANFIVYGMVVKILASILIFILSALLILAMRKASQRRSRLKQKVRRVLKAEGGGDSDPQTREHNRNTAMLATVVISFVVTEFPQGVLNLSAALSLCFHLKVYAKIGAMMDALVLLNSSINFVLYCAMSQQFRETFYNLFIGCKRATPPRNGYRAAQVTTAL